MYSSEAQLWSSGLSVQFGGESTSASDHVRVLGVTISSDLSLEKHVANVCSSGFYWLCQLRRVRRSLDTDSMKTLVHAFVMSRVDYCNAILTGSPKQATTFAEGCSTSRHRYTKVRPRPVILVAWRVALAWHPRTRPLYKLGVTVHRCLHDKAPKYLVDCCTLNAWKTQRQEVSSTFSGGYQVCWCWESNIHRYS